MSASKTGDQIWIGEHITYNFKTHQMQSEQFRTGKAPVFAAGQELEGDTSNKVYNCAPRVRDDGRRERSGLSHPREPHQDRPRQIHRDVECGAVRRATCRRFIFRITGATSGRTRTTGILCRGYRSSYGPYILDTYTWWLNDAVDGKFHLDYREKRGPGVGPDLNLHLGQWGDASFKYYYMHDHDQYDGTNGLPDFGSIPENRQRVYFGWQATPSTNLNVKALVNYQSDAFWSTIFLRATTAKTRSRTRLSRRINIGTTGASTR